MTNSDIPFVHEGKIHLFPANSLIFVEGIPYETIAKAHGSHNLDLIEDKYVEINKNCIGSNFDDFLKEEGILEEVEAIAKEKLEEIKNTIKEDKCICGCECAYDASDGKTRCAHCNGKIIKTEEIVEEIGEGICLGGFIPVEGAEDLPVIEEIKEEIKEEVKEIGNGSAEEKTKTTTETATKTTSSTSEEAKPASKEKEKVEENNKRSNSRKRNNK